MFRQTLGTLMVLILVFSGACVAQPRLTNGVLPTAPELSTPPFNQLTNRCLPASLLMCRHLRDAGFQAKVLTLRLTDTSKNVIGHALCVFSYSGKTWVWDCELGSIVIGDENLINNVSIFVTRTYLDTIKLHNTTIIESEFIYPSALDKCR